MKTAHEASVRAHDDQDFVDDYLTELNNPDHAFLHDMVITGANELAEGDPILAGRIRRFGCQLLYATESALTIEQLRQLFGEPLDA